MQLHFSPWHAYCVKFLQDHALDKEKKQTDAESKSSKTS